MHSSTSTQAVEQKTSNQNESREHVPRRPTRTPKSSRTLRNSTVLNMETASLNSAKTDSSMVTQNIAQRICLFKLFCGLAVLLVAGLVSGTVFYYALKDTSV
ncbi:uncharacterized protein NEMAJ01_0182 [Nematocida major]|uniref:uncharacterized protein n=1 Tax=Nematocida major TaxID=1912982 RepID=UPI002007D099|nr:uncharacterized protein NEMAJ01_0182 [Nematocida major]KAH9385286.1 hypothetical protein NEMAJ01_0182 [Nematocida major]